MSYRTKSFANEHLKEKCMPYLFFTSGATKKAVIDAYTMSVQRFFVKPNTIERLEVIIRKIVEHWQECIAPGQHE